MLFRSWMYPIERRLCTLKSFIRNRARPEASIAEAYIYENERRNTEVVLEDADGGLIARTNGGQVTPDIHEEIGIQDADDEEEDQTNHTLDEGFTVKVSIVDKEINTRMKHTESEEADYDEEVEDLSLEEYMDCDGLMDSTNDECGYHDDDEEEN